ncbi:MAG TPA: hypothetical protein DC058_23170 [Planctomycetaceae bacterium]|nr:hypothetical protein [Planctomycetaceae bacterium]HBC64104.1 hypothetical protein [Planctomycetaceae bacterium]
MRNLGYRAGFGPVGKLGEPCRMGLYSGAGFRRKPPIGLAIPLPDFVMFTLESVSGWSGRTVPRAGSAGT